jgi:hypothetical protein
VGTAGRGQETGQAGWVLMRGCVRVRDFMCACDWMWVCACGPAGKTGRFRLEVSANVDVFVALAPPHPRTDPIQPPPSASRARRPRSAFP